MKRKKIPLRTCIVSKEKLEKNNLFRIVRDKDGNVFVDDTLKANGRGCYLKKDKEIIQKAKLSKALNKALNAEVNSNIYDELINKF